MKNKDLLCGFIVALPLVAPFSANCAKKSDTGAQPNIIFILTDDQRWDAAGFAGNKIISTPNLDMLAKNGVYFRNTYATTAISCVSRATILTGQHQMTHGISEFSKQLTEDQLVKTYPLLLKEAGYYTGFIGKYGVGAKDEPTTRYDYWGAFTGQGQYWKNNKIGIGKHLTQLQGEQIKTFIDGRDKDKPFCLSVSFKAPHCQDDLRKPGHNEFPTDPRDAELYENVTMPYPKTRDDSYYEALPEWFRYSSVKKKENEARVRWKYRFDGDDMYQKTVKNYYRLISGVDRQIGFMMEELKKQGLDENTIIIFMGDNGFYLGEHGLAGKWFTHEESVRLPMFIYDPRLPKSDKGKVVQQIALNIDIAPTILALAGVVAPNEMDGQSLLPLIRGKQKEWRKNFYYEHTFNPNAVNIPCSEAIIGGDYKLTRYYADGNECFELFDVKNDPYEIVNLATQPQSKALLEKMIKDMSEAKTNVQAKHKP